jgi:hypothetical protein
MTKPYTRNTIAVIGKAQPMTRRVPSSTITVMIAPMIMSDQLSSSM